MPKQKHLTTRYTIRLSDYLSNEMIKHTLKSGQDYSSFIRMCIANYLKNNNPMSAVKTHNSGVIDDDVLSVDMFATSSSRFIEDTPKVEDDFCPVGKSLYGWD